MFERKKPLAVGVDIGSSSVKVLEMTERRNQYRVERFAVEPLPRNAVVENAITDIDRVAKVVRTAIRKSGSRRVYAVSAVAAAQALSKTIVVPGGLKGNALDQQVELEARHHVPSALEGTNIDYETLGPSAENPSNDEVLLAACRRDIIEERTAALVGAGLKPLIVDIVSLANEKALSLIAPSLPDHGDGEVIAILDCGATSSHLYVVHGWRLIYHRDYPLGGKMLTENIQRSFGVSYSEAENKKRLGDLPKSYEKDFLGPFIESMAHIANRAIQLFVSSTHHERVDRIIVTGGGAALPHAAERIGDKTGIPTLTANPFANTGVSSKVAKERLYRHAPVLTTACGLAMRGAER